MFTYDILVTATTILISRKNERDVIEAMITDQDTNAIRPIYGEILDPPALNS